MRGVPHGPVREMDWSSQSQSLNSLRTDPEVEMSTPSPTCQGHPGPVGSGRTPQAINRQREGVIPVAEAPTPTPG